MIFPRAQMACSHTFCCLESSKRRKSTGTASACTTNLVWSEFPDAILVMAHAASNWRAGLCV